MRPPSLLNERLSVVARLAVGKLAFVCQRPPTRPTFGKPLQCRILFLPPRVVPCVRQNKIQTGAAKKYCPLTKHAALEGDLLS